MVGDFLYPHGEARANYVQYLADALVHCGYKVVILGKINSEFCNEMEFSFRNVTIKEIEQKGGNRLFDVCVMEEGDLSSTLSII